MPVLVNMGHEVICCVRDKNRMPVHEEFVDSVQVIEVDFLKLNTLENIPTDIDGAYFLIHSMSSNSKNFEKLESVIAYNFREKIEKTNVKHVIYLGGIINETKLSQHLHSRKMVDSILSKGAYSFTALNAGIILGSGSASFEIIRDLVEKLPVMIAPVWLLTKSQPIAVRNVIQFLSRTLFNEYTYGQRFDIGGPDILTYKEMLLKFSKIRNLTRSIYIMPWMTPRLSSYWLYIVTSTSHELATNLVNSMNVPIICQKNDLATILGIELLSFNEAIENAFLRIQQNAVISSWIDSLVSGRMETSLKKYIQIPEYGCYTNVKKRRISDQEKVLKNIWSIGGNTGWYYANWLWRLRGFLDKLAGGVGLRRGRTNLDSINPGDALDFWRVLLADREKRRMLLFAEMKLPGEAWLEFRIDENNMLYQKATFRPKGILGRFYWYSMLPFHYFIFNGMVNNVTRE